MNFFKKHERFVRILIAISGLALIASSFLPFLLTK
jgi:hypothetical protein